jgi:8-oxo-dGTP pyrophosphatase MutT (NUDIX family)
MGMSDYVRGLREKIGNDLLLMPAVVGFIRDGEGRVLLVQHVEGRWQLPGGAVDPGERPEEALCRECLEEANAEVRPSRIAGVFGGPEYRATYANGDEIAFVVVAFEAELVGGELRPDQDETQDVAWFAPADVDGLEMHASTRMTLSSLLRAP